MTYRGTDRETPEVSIAAAIVAAALGAFIYGGGFAVIVDPPDLQPQAELTGARARALLKTAFQGVDTERLFDHHVHIAGLPPPDQTENCTGDVAAWVNPRRRSWRHPVPARLVPGVQGGERGDRRGQRQRAVRRSTGEPGVCLAEAAW